MGNYKKYSDEFKQEVLGMVAVGDLYVREYERYFNTPRPHLVLVQVIHAPPSTSSMSVSGKIKRRDILGGIIHGSFRVA